MNRFNIFSRQSIRFNVTVALIIIAVLPSLVINLFYYFNISSTYNEKLQNYQSDMLELISDKVQTLADQCILAENQIIELAITSQFFNDYSSKSDLQRLEILRLTEPQIIAIRRAFIHVKDIYLIGVDQTVFTTNASCDKAELLKQPWVESSMDQLTASKLMVPTHLAEYQFYQKQYQMPYVVSSIIRLQEYNSNRAIGIIQIDLDYQSIVDAAEAMEISEKDFVIILDSDNNIIYAPDTSLAGQQVRNKQYAGYDLETLVAMGNQKDSQYDDELIVQNSRIQGFGWTITQINSSDTLIDEFNQLRQILYLIMAASVLFAVLMAYGMSKGITNPIRKLSKYMGLVSSGNLDVSAQNINNKDLHVLADNFNDMVVQIKHLIDENHQKDVDRMVMELTTLQSQINSHFTYNTLNTIKWMSIRAKEEDITETVVAFVKILEYTCQGVDLLVPIEKEIDFIRQYSIIQEKRIGNKIEIEYEPGQEIERCLVLKMLLQPVVENAILHGFSTKDDKRNIIRIKTHQENGNLIVEVSDNGIGMKTDAINQMTGIGLSNIESRIKLNFGECYGIDIYSEPGLGTTVSLRLPIVMDKDDINEQDFSC